MDKLDPKDTNRGRDHHRGPVLKPMEGPARPVGPEIRANLLKQQAMLALEPFIRRAPENLLFGSGSGGVSHDDKEGKKLAKLIWEAFDAGVEPDELPPSLLEKAGLGSNPAR